MNSENYEWVFKDPFKGYKGYNAQNLEIGKKASGQ